jgi:hypothetical protein
MTCDKNPIEIYQTEDGQTQIEVLYVWFQNYESKRQKPALPYQSKTSL